MSSLIQQDGKNQSIQHDLAKPPDCARHQCSTNVCLGLCRCRLGVLQTWYNTCILMSMKVLMFLSLKRWSLLNSWSIGFYTLLNSFSARCSCPESVILGGGEQADLFHSMVCWATQTRGCAFHALRQGWVHIFLWAQFPSESHNLHPAALSVVIKTRH